MVVMGKGPPAERLWTRRAHRERRRQIARIETATLRMRRLLKIFKKTSKLQLASWVLLNSQFQN
jgi:hypothetical protein